MSHQQHQQSAHMIIPQTNRSLQSYQEWPVSVEPAVDPDRIDISPPPSDFLQGSSASSRSSKPPKEAKRASLSLPLSLHSVQKSAFLPTGPRKKRKSPQTQESLHSHIRELHESSLPRVAKKFKHSHSGAVDQEPSAKETDSALRRRLKSQKSKENSHRPTGSTPTDPAQFPQDLLGFRELFPPLTVDFPSIRQQSITPPNSLAQPGGQSQSPPNPTKVVVETHSTPIHSEQGVKRTLSETQLDQEDHSSEKVTKRSKPSPAVKPPSRRNTRTRAKPSSSKGSRSSPTKYKCAIDHWRNENYNWPSSLGYEESDMPRKRGLLYEQGKKGKLSESQATPLTQVNTSDNLTTKIIKGVGYSLDEYEKHLRKNDCFMQWSDPPKKVEEFCDELMAKPVTWQHPDSLLFSSAKIKSVFEKHALENEAKVAANITPSIFPTSDALDFAGVEDVDSLATKMNAQWTHCCPIVGPPPKPDISVGFGQDAFTASQQQTIRNLESQDDGITFATVCPDLHFPFLTCEVKGRGGSMRVAQRQNMHSACVVMKNLVELSKPADRHKLHHGVLFFSFSHNETMACIHAYYPRIEGDKVSFHRYQMKHYAISDNKYKGRWTAYDLTRKIYKHFKPAHLELIGSILNGWSTPGSSDLNTASDPTPPPPSLTTSSDPLISVSEGHTTIQILDATISPDLLTPGLDVQSAHIHPSKLSSTIKASEAPSDLSSRGGACTHPATVTEVSDETRKAGSLTIMQRNSSTTFQSALSIEFTRKGRRRAKEEESKKRTKSKSPSPSASFTPKRRYPKRKRKKVTRMVPDFAEVI
ncbi:MAG: hypothetical protein M1814_006243 [Vezdaea aestivalis]|nr:MAG: hypothetical protein M1814_006243 [Vezdaea aestivalis]